jgi:uncharacterized protein YggE
MTRVRADDQQATKDRLSFNVRGKASQMADEVAIDLTVTGSAEEASEAEKKYREKLGHVLNALGKGDGKTPADEDAPKKRRKKKDDDSDAAPKKKKKADDSADDDDAPKAKKKKKASDDADDDAPKPKKKKPAIDDDDDDDAPKKKDAKKDDSKKDDSAKDDSKKDDSKKDEAKKDDAKAEPKKDEAKKDEAKKDEAKKDDAKAEEFPFELKEGGLSFGIKGGDANQQRMRRMMGQQQQKEEPEFRFSSTLTVLFKNVSKADPKALRKRIADILDKVSDAGVDTAVSPEGDGTPPVVRFSCTEPEDLKVKAYTDAMAAARKRGANLANLADRALGKVVAVRDQTALPQSTHRQQQPYYNNYGYQVSAPLSLGEDWSTEVVMEVDLYVEFELKDKK